MDSLKYVFIVMNCLTVNMPKFKQKGWQHNFPSGLNCQGLMEGRGGTSLLSHSRWLSQRLRLYSRDAAEYCKCILRLHTRQVLWAGGEQTQKLRSGEWPGFCLRTYVKLGREQIMRFNIGLIEVSIHLQIWINREAVINWDSVHLVIFPYLIGLILFHRIREGGASPLG